ncbi:MAG: hypothetical protein ACLFTK_14280 [Anaerolineales bacterium]
MGHVPEEQLQEAHEMSAEDPQDNSWMVFIALGAIFLLSIGAIFLAGLVG